MTRLSKRLLAVSLAVSSIAFGASPSLATVHHHHHHHHHHHVATAHHRPVVHHHVRGHHTVSGKGRYSKTHAHTIAHTHTHASAAHPVVSGKRHAALCQQVMVRQHWVQHCR